MRGAGAARVALSCAAWLLAAAVCTEAGAAASDICENETGTELVRCIEAAARAGAGKAATGAAHAPARNQREGAPAGETRAREAAPAADCSGRQAEALRHCLAAGGRLGPDAAVVTPPAQNAAVSRPGAAQAESCDAHGGEALRACIEHAARKDPATRNGEPQIVRCTGYGAADQPLCLHRNSALIACRNRALYPDREVCLRSRMSGAPEPERADCNRVPAQARAHCEARNRAYAACRSDKMAYFACLEQKLGDEAVLPATARSRK